MKKRTKQILAIMHFLCWVVFIGLCIKTGAIIYSFIVSLFINPIAASNLYLGLNLSELKEFSKEGYSIMAFLVVALWALRAYMFYLVINIFLKTNFAQPFSEKVGSLITRISYVAVAIGVLALMATGYNDWLVKKGVVLHNLSGYISGGAEFLFFAGIIFIISFVFKIGMELQLENQLTV